MPEIYVVTAIETDGPIPGPCSLLSFASAAYTRDKVLHATFSANLERLPDAEGDPSRIAWWKSQPEAWAVCRHEPEPVVATMQRYADWLVGLPSHPVYVGNPAAIGYAFINWYLHRFTGSNPMGRGALDMRTLAMALVHRPYRQSKLRFMPESWTRDVAPRTCVVLDDALASGKLFCHMLDDWRKTPKPRKHYEPASTDLKLKADE